MEKPEDNSTQ